MKKKDTGLMLEPEEPLVSQDVCTTIIDASKHAVNRCRDLCHGQELEETLRKIYFILLDSLCNGHFEEGLSMAISGECQQVL